MMRAAGLFLFWLALTVPGFADELRKFSGRPSAAAMVPTLVERRLPCTVAYQSEGLTIVEVDSTDATRPSRTIASLSDRSRHRELKVGDVIRQVDGRAITSIQDYFEELNRGTGAATLTIKDSSSGDESKWLASPLEVDVPAWRAPSAPVTGARVHVIYAAQTDDSLIILDPKKQIGPSIERHVDRLREAVHSLVGPERLASYQLLKGGDCSVARIQAVIDALEVRENDSIFFYYEGHGARDVDLAPRDPARGQFFHLVDGDILRSELLKRLAAKRPRFTLLGSNCCNAPSDFRGWDTLMERRVVTGWTKLEHLLLCHRGVVDFNSSCPGELSWFSDDVGGWFTFVLHADLFGGAGLHRRHWSDFFGELGTRTDEFFREQKLAYPGDELLQKQATMHPAMFTLNAYLEEPADPPLDDREIDVPRSIAKPLPR